MWKSIIKHLKYYSFALVFCMLLIGIGIGEVRLIGDAVTHVTEFMGENLIPRLSLSLRTVVITMRCTYWAIFFIQILLLFYRRKMERVVIHNVYVSIALTLVIIAFIEYFSFIVL